MSQPIVITPGTDLTPFIGVRVRVVRQYTGRPAYTHYGVFTSLWHHVPTQVLNEGTGATCVLGKPHCGGMLTEEPHHDCRGGQTGFDLPYPSVGLCTVEPAPKEV